MAKNRKNQSAAIRFGPALKAILLCLLIGGSGVGYVWQKNQVWELGRQFSRQEANLKQLRIQNEKLRRQLATLRSPAMVEQRIKELNLGLVQIQAAQIQPLQEPLELGPSANLPASANRALAARRESAAIP